MTAVSAIDGERASNLEAPRAPSLVARWDLDKTYLRTDFDTARDLLRTAFERPDQKRTVPGAAALLRELVRAGGEAHILSGSPEQLRGRIEEKLRLDGVRYASLTLKPNLENLLRLRFRALRGQLGYKLPALLRRRCELRTQRSPDGQLIPEILLGDDAEADAFVYSLYADVCAGRVQPELLREVMRSGRAYEDTIKDTLRFATYVERGAFVRRILIHLDRQSSPGDFAGYGPRVVPFYNYLQAALVLFEDGLLPAKGLLALASELVTSHHFDRSALVRSVRDLARRGVLVGRGTAALEQALEEHRAVRRGAVSSELAALIDALAGVENRPREVSREPLVDYLALVERHNPRSRTRR